MHEPTELLRTISNTCWILTELETVAILMHCYLLRPPDVAPIVIRFNCEPSTEFEVGQPTVPDL